MAMIVVSHDLPLVRRLASRIVVMREGRVIETGATRALFAAPREPYTRLLVEATPQGLKPASPAGPILLEARGIRVTYSQPAGPMPAPHRVCAVDGVDLTVRSGATVGIVGTSVILLLEYSKTNPIKQTNLGLAMARLDAVVSFRDAQPDTLARIAKAANLPHIERVLSA
jgi:ABC-type microcin C transport system duplicated ATPase subunit YejF